MTRPGHDLGLLAAQRGVWTGQQLDPESPAYNTAEYVEIHGPVDPETFARALHRAIGETDALHVRFPVFDGLPRQRAVSAPTSPADVPLCVMDLTAAPDPRGEAFAWMRGDLDRPVDLAAEPPYGHALLRLSEDRALWYHRVHHIALDGFGLAMVARRVAEVYTALSEDEPIADSGFRSLADVVAEEEHYRQSERYARDQAYWRERFADRPTVRTPAARVAFPARHFLREVTDLSEGHTRRLREVAEELSVTWPEVLLAVTVAHLGQTTGAAEIILSVPVTNRLGSVALRVPAMVRNIVPLRVPVRAGDSPRDLTARVAAELRSALPHQRYRYEELRGDLGLIGGERRLSGVGVNIMPFEYDLRFAGHPGTVHNLSAGPVDDLALNVYDRSGGTGPRLALDANPRLYDTTDLKRQQAGLLTMLEAALAAPRAVSSTSRPAPVPGATDTVPSHVLPATPLLRRALPVSVLLAEVVARRGQLVAVEHDGQMSTYEQLFAAARRTAAALAAHGAGPGTRVAVLLPRGIPAITTLLGALLSGAAYCPLDRTAPPARLRDLLSGLDPVVTVTEREGLPSHGTPLTPDQLVDHGTDLVTTVAGDPPLDAQAYVMHTSGSTGRPKGVRISHRALAHFLAAASQRYELRPTDRVLQFAPPHFDTSVEEILLTLTVGARVVVRDEAMLQSPAHLTRGCADRRVTVLDLPTAYWHELVPALATGAARLPACVRTVIIGGEPALPERVARWNAVVPATVRLLNTYGPTETTVVATTADLGPDAWTGQDDVPIGTPLPGVGATVVNGELHLLGDGLADGYLGDVASAEAARFTRLTALPGSPRAYRTGDLVDVGAGGLLRYRGRVDEEFKISGHRVQPAEVESALLTHPAVRAAVVVGLTASDGRRRLAALAVPPPDTTAPSGDELRHHLRGRLPAQMVPTRIDLTDRLPTNSVGKIDRAAVRTRLATAPPAAVPASGQGGVPASGQEGALAIAGVWSQLLGAEVRPEEDVFARGAQSLQAIQATGRISAALGREVTLALLFEHPTPAGLAGHLAAPGPPPAAASAELSRDATLAPDLVIAPLTARAGAPRSVLLTGATGFVGAHLLAELLANTSARIVCPVRAPDRAAAVERLRAALTRYRRPHLDLDRVIAPPADLARPDLGLDADGERRVRSCEVFLHNAAAVGVLRPYAASREANVESTRALLRLAASEGAPFHLVSTLSVAPPRSLAAEVPEEFLDLHAGLVSGYQRSKWAAEHLARQAAERGLPVAVHRLGRVVGPADTGAVNEQDFLFSVLRAGLPAGVLPDMFESEVWTPADWAARTITALLAHQPPPGGAVYHHASSEPVRLRDLVEWSRAGGYPVRLVPAGRWHESLPPASGTTPPGATAPGTNEVVAALGAFLTERADQVGPSNPSDPGTGAERDLDLGLGKVHTERVRRRLGEDAACPRPDRALFHRYLANTAIPPPGRGPGAHR